jgi:hypothetical protein
MDEILSRAYSAYFKTAKREGYFADQPAEGASGQQEHGDKSYLVLRNRAGVLAVYRVRNDGVLKRLRRWPADLGANSAGTHIDESIRPTRVKRIDTTPTPEFMEAFARAEKNGDASLNGIRATFGEIAREKASN